MSASGSRPQSSGPDRGSRGRSRERDELTWLTRRRPQPTQAMYQGLQSSGPALLFQKLNSGNDIMLRTEANIVIVAGGIAMGSK